MTPLGCWQTLLTGHIAGGDKRSGLWEGGGGTMWCHGVRTRTRRQVEGDDSGHVEGEETSQTTVPPGAPMVSCFTLPEELKEVDQDPQHLLILSV